ncbi:methylenetetrahydrofolate--tRNA-(uracil(54)-C(5))-methyltransferase (FADH(2)-oxidizing) TrmFO [Youxingia wuxianensis]|uniref:Methylenetetrahydrofolate--tRNA-(uracil-5-)-methyltransferase TrmFO n=1 Tax=Youxingia wuxianensis TaxID=2763678 RepID=A0A926EKR3_9FIRM|nr:methylenetetrahydrofolate--tRNA-(uracil(54)-C(5))-methyltransferase (FADH(2)-oxidizing) TrmFO [Youxingia wuxianensis]MBC8584381.1 methylenetetrahydrofolate--tRNA-(uracil(54)-C(5))-methyltransferase (FADH(2)-oxidizing) TrmFO [Youxingia wuxianensis]
MNKTVTIIGAGLAGCEAAWILSQQGISVRLHEMKPQKFSPAHHSENFAELVCSNSLKAQRLGSAAGMLKEEMRLMGSLVVDCALQTSVAAGGALAVDREEFSALVTRRIKQQENIEIISGEVTSIPKDGYTIIATGPLTSDAFAAEIENLCGGSLSFFDAAAPIVTYESLEKEKIFFAARYGRGEDDYINCPFNKQEYERFHQELINAQTVPLKEFDKRDFKVYEGCMPVEVMAKRGADTMRYGPLKPVGLRDPATGKRPWAVVQLRRENKEGTLYNLVGFQTNLKFGEQKRVFSLIPGLAHADFVRYGVMHRNTFINSPKLLDSTFCMRERENIYFAGQITGVEGYVESAMSGLLAGTHLARKLKGLPDLALPLTSMSGALSHYISGCATQDFQPMGCNMGILPPWPQRVKDKQERYLLIAQRGLRDLKAAIGEE